MPFVIPSEGGCQCGEIRYRLIGEPILLTVCHCTDCKHQSGSALGMSLRMRKADVELSKGAPKQWNTRSDNGNPKICVFCGAATVLIAIIGARMRTPATCVSKARSNWPA